MRTVAARMADPRALRASPWAAAGGLAVLGLVALDVGAVAAALPSARVELGSSSSGLVWVQDGYLLALAVGMLAVGRLSGAESRLVAIAGLAAYAGGATLASTADGTAVLVTGRVLQGAGTAVLLAPAIESLRPAAGGRSRLSTAIGAAALFGLALAPLVGGGIAQEADWRWLFRLELAAAVPVGLLALGGGRSPEGERTAGEGGEPPTPSVKAAALAGGLACAVTGLVQSGPWGWASADTLVLLAPGAALLAFAWRDGLRGREAAALTLAGCLSAALLVAPQYVELVRGLSPLRSGLLTLALTLPAATLIVLAVPLAGRLPRRLLPAGGLACAAVGALGMTRIDPASRYALVVLSLALLGAGIGAAAGGLARDAGGTAVVRAACVGATLVVAATGALFQRAQVGERESGGSFEDALAAGVGASGWLLAALLIAAAALAWRRSGQRRRQHTKLG